MRTQMLPALALLAAASLTARAQSVTLRYKFASGQTRHYQMHMTMTTTMLTGQSGAGVPISTDAVVTWMQTVKSVRASDGAATVVTQLGDMQMSVNGRHAALPPVQQAQMKHPFTSVILPTGKVLSFQAPQLSNANMAGMDFSKGLFSSTVAFPQSAVKVGGSWQGTATSSMAGMQMLMASQLVGLKPVGSAKLATIRQKLSGNIHMALSKHMPMKLRMAGVMSGGGTEVFDTTLGAVRSQSMTANADMTMTFRSGFGQALLTKMPRTMKMRMQEKTNLQLLDALSPVR